MLNRNSNCYNFEKNFKYSAIINMFSEHITILRTLSIDIWQLKCQQRQTNKTKTGKLFFGKLFRIIKFFFPILLRKATLKSAFLLHTSKTFFTKFFATNFRHQNKNNVGEKFCCFVNQLSKKYCVYYVTEHLKYCTQINEYWLNKYACLNIVLHILIFFFFFNFYCLWIIQHLKVFNLYHFSLHRRGYEYCKWLNMLAGKNKECID